MRRRTATAFVTLLAIMAGTTWASTDLERAAIERTLTAFTEAWNRHDAKEFSALFTVDAEFTNVAEMSATGRKAIEDFHARPFTTNFKDSNQIITRSRIKFIKPDVAAVDAWWEMTGARTPAGQDAGLRRGRLSLVMTKIQDQWLIAVMNNTNLGAPASAPSR